MAPRSGKDESKTETEGECWGALFAAEQVHLEHATLPCPSPIEGTSLPTLTGFLEHLTGRTTLAETLSGIREWTR